MQFAVNTRHWTLCLYWASVRVCERGTLLFTQSYTPLTFAKCFWDRDPRKKKLCFVSFSPFGLIFSHGDVYQYLRELGQMGLFLCFTWICGIIQACPSAKCWPCWLIGKVWSCELPINTSAHPSYAGLFFCNMKQGWTWLFLYVWIILRFSFRSGQDWGFRTKVQNSSFKAKKGHGVGRGLICIHTCTYERVYLYVHTFRTGNCICKLDLVILCNKICSIKSNPVRVCVWERENDQMHV